MINLYIEKKDCCGCTACKSICPVNAITMEVDEEGFLYPKINNTRCTECGKCEDICAFKESKENENNYDEQKIYAVKHKNETVRMTSSSGGMFTALSDYILENDGIVYGAVFDKSFMICHQRADAQSKRNKMKGSKYVQSNLYDTFSNVKQDLLNGRIVLFTGTPCQMAGLQSFLEDTDKSSFYLCDVICHGVTSPLFWKDYLSFLERKYISSVKEVSFRSKDFSDNRASMKVVFDTEVYKNDFSTDYFYHLYMNNFILRESCHNCKFTNLQRTSDITIGDFWGIEKQKPQFDDGKGVSLVLINSEKGKFLFDKVSAKIDFLTSEEKECLPRQPQLQHPSEANPNRALFWNLYKKEGFTYALKKFTPYGSIFRIKKVLENFIYKILKNYT